MTAPCCPGYPHEHRASSQAGLQALIHRVPWPTATAPGPSTADVEALADAGLLATRRAETTTEDPESRYCGRGICAAPEGHAGTCAEASGWDHDWRDDSAETTTATTEDAARVLTEHRFHGSTCLGCGYNARLDGYRASMHQAQALADANMLARPLPDRDELAEAISDSDTVPCDVCADSRCRYCWGDACRKADAVLGLLRGGGDDR